MRDLVIALCGRQRRPSNSPYNIYRKDRPDGYGGSLLLIKSYIISEPVDIQTSCDIIFRKIHCSDSQTLIIGSAYRSTNNDIDYTNELVEVIRNICHKYSDAVVWLAGDFNLPDIDWSRNAITRTSSVTEMISTLGWDTLQKRRDLARLSMMYRIVHHLVDIPVEPYLTPLTSMTRGHDPRFFQIQTSNTTYQQSFFPRTVILWNQLPQTAVSQATLEAFQNQLATHTF